MIAIIGGRPEKRAKNVAGGGYVGTVTKRLTVDWQTGVGTSDPIMRDTNVLRPFTDWSGGLGLGPEILAKPAGVGMPATNAMRIPKFTPGNEIFFWLGLVPATGWPTLATGDSRFLRWYFYSAIPDAETGGSNPNATHPMESLDVDANGSSVQAFIWYYGNLTDGTMPSQVVSPSTTPWRPGTGGGNYLYLSKAVAHMFQVRFTRVGTDTYDLAVRTYNADTGALEFDETNWRLRDSPWTQMSTAGLGLSLNDAQVNYMRWGANNGFAVSATRYVWYGGIMVWDSTSPLDWPGAYVAGEATTA